MAIDPFALLAQRLAGCEVEDKALICALRIAIDAAGSRILAIEQGSIQVQPDDGRAVDGTVRVDAPLLAGLCSGHFPPAHALMLNGVRIDEGDFALIWTAILAIFSENQRKT